MDAIRPTKRRRLDDYSDDLGHNFNNTSASDCGVDDQQTRSSSAQNGTGAGDSFTQHSLQSLNCGNAGTRDEHDLTRGKSSSHNPESNHAAPVDTINYEKRPNDLQDGCEMCFGMFIITSIEWKNIPAWSLGSCIPAEVHDRTILSSSQHPSDSPVELGAINLPKIKKSVDVGEVLDRLSSKRGVFLEYFIRKREISPQNGGKQGRKFSKASEVIELLVNLYGRPSMFEPIGRFFQGCKIHLQDPRLCGRDLPYKNPHMLAQSEDIVMTSTFGTSSATETFIAPEDVFDCLLQSDKMTEAETPLLVKTLMHSHQKQALFFMRQKERGSLLDTDRSGTRSRSLHFDPSCLSKTLMSRGGLIADQMGLGKTLQMISLIASDHDHANEVPALPASIHPRHIKPQVSATLVVVPVSLLQVWDAQLNRHLVSGKLRWTIFHGPRRNANMSPAEHNICLTTYETVRSEYHKYTNTCDRNPLFTVTWRRIVLDEAHEIRNVDTQRTRAICALEGTYRWAVTGTPIQNRLMDLFSIIHFLRIHPFDDFTFFDNHILQPWKTQSNPLAVSRLKEVVQCMAIRRTKGAFSLPPRDNQIRRLTFNAAEREKYEVLRLQVQKSILSNNASLISNNSLNVLQWIDSLRFMCSNGSSERGCGEAITSSEAIDQVRSGFSNAQDEELLEDHRLSISASTQSSSLLTESTASSCLASGPHHRLETSSYGNDLLSPMLAYGFSQTPGSSCASPSMSENSFCETTPSLFTKTEVLLNDIIANEGKTVVFSFWRSTLHSVARALHNADISFLKIHGEMKRSERDSAVEEFQCKPEIKVLLTTVAVGGVGLDLTAANQACLLEPQWNPAAEEQALSRVHRIGQTKPVTTIRYVMRNSVEEKVLELQQRKRRLAVLALSGGQAPKDSSYIEDLKALLS